MTHPRPQPSNPQVDHPSASTMPSLDQRTNPFREPPPDNSTARQEPQPRLEAEPSTPPSNIGLTANQETPGTPLTVSGEPGLRNGASLPSTELPKRNLVLLLDGTAKEFCDKNTNLIKLYTVLKAGEDQLIYYSSGLGTILPSSTSSWAVGRTIAAWRDTAFAWNFEDFVCDAYHYLMDHYRAGDLVFIFGFSRGGYVARTLAGMIQKVGLLPPGNHRSIPGAYRVYTDKGSVRGEREDAGSDSPGAVYRRIFGRTRPVIIEFLGAWDTVSSLGGWALPVLPFAGGVQAVRFFRHALALDERRVRFMPEYQHYGTDEKELLDPINEAKAKRAKARRANNAEGVKEANSALEKAKSEFYKVYPSRSWTSDHKRRKRTRIECWFMGSHSDVGGGDDLNGDPSLSNIPFRWMLNEAVECGIELSATGLQYLKATEMPTLPPEASSHSQPIPEQPSNDTIRDLKQLYEIVTAQLQNPQSEQESLQRQEDLRSSIPQSELLKLVHLAAERDICAGEPSKDAKRPPSNSLWVPWWALEIIPLQTRKYCPDRTLEKATSGWWPNWGSPRQMVPGQRVHRSVLRRMQATVSKTMPLYRPAARLAHEFESWEEAIENPDHDMWLRRDEDRS